MTLELLSNELFIDLFEYFNAVDLLRAFGALNTRLNSLLFDYCRTYRVDFRSIFRKDFDVFYRTYLPSIKNRIIYLRLSDDDDTPYQCARFLSDGVTLGQFEALRSLTLNKVSRDPRITQVYFADLHRLRHLTHLKFVDCPLFHVKGTDFQGIIDQIWNLPQLIHCHWDCSFNGTHSFCIPTCVSTSLQYLTIYQQYWSSNDFGPLFAKTPRLRKFSVSLETYEDDDRPVFQKFLPSSPHLSVTKLILSQVCSQRLLNNLLYFLPNVNHLKIETTSSIKFNGHQWEQIIVKSLPQLKVFQLKMSVHFPWTSIDENHEEKFDRYFDTYRTSFWIEHQWFIRCHWGLWNKYLCIYLYSLPYVFNDYPIPDNNLNLHTKSTCSNDLPFSYDSIRQIGSKPWMFNDQVMSHVQLINIEKLFVELPFDYRFLSVIPTFSNLHSLAVDIPPTDYELQLQVILDSAPHLHTLLFYSWTTMIMPPYRLKSPSIHRLDVQGCDQLRDRYRYNDEQCVELSRSPLGIQCRVLTIEVEDIECILLLTYIMINLRTLHVRLEGDHRGNKHDLVKILQESLPLRWNAIRFGYGNIIVRS